MSIALEKNLWLTTPAKEFQHSDGQAEIREHGMSRGGRTFHLPTSALTGYRKGKRTVAATHGLFLVLLLIYCR